jgi:predicted nucleotidyltransferase
LLEYKAATAESHLMPRIAILDDYLRDRIIQRAGTTAALSQPAPDHPLLDRIFRIEIHGPAAESAADYTLDRVRRRDILLFETVAGSHAYGTAIETSDQDLRGVFVAPTGLLGGLDSIEQVACERNDHIYYELGRFIDLLLRNNPNALELLAMPDDCVRVRHPLFDLLDPALFLSKLCALTFGEYAMGQIRKARGLNKKIVNPQPETRLPLLAFCHVPTGQGSVPVLDWLQENHLTPADCGLTAVRNAPDLFAIYQAPAGTHRGLVSPRDPDALVFSSVPKDAQPVAWMHFNEDAFKAHCKAHREYWQWVAERNQERYATNAAHGRGYDSKNLMHTIRLLEMAGEIAREGVLRIRRPNRDFLLQIRSGEFSYDDLVARAEALHASLPAAYAASSLPETPDRAAINRLLIEIRAGFGTQE